MHLEIERKFLLLGDEWRALAIERRDLRDGLISQGENGKVRVRLDGSRAFLTVKGARQGISRPEFEYEIPVEDAERLLTEVCTGVVVEKERYVVPYGGHVWEIDVFKGSLGGLVWAEVELAHEDQAFARPAWIGREVTGDPRFRHTNLLLLCAAADGRDALGRLLEEAGLQAMGQAQGTAARSAVRQRLADQPRNAAAGDWR